MSEGDGTEARPPIRPKETSAFMLADYAIARHMLGLRHGLPGARYWRQVWSNHQYKHLSAAEVSALARQRKLAA